MRHLSTPQAVTPVHRRAVHVSNGNNDNLVDDGLVDDPVREALHLATPNGATQNLPRLRKPLDAPQRQPRLVAERITQSRLLRVVITDGFDEFATRRSEERKPQV